MFTMIFAILTALLLIISGSLITFILILIKNQKNEEKYNNTINDQIISSVLQVVAYDYHVRAIRCGYGEIMDHDNEKYMKFDDMIQWNCLEVGSSVKNARYSINLYKEKAFDHLVYIVNYRLFGNYYIAYGKNPLIAWSIVIRNARAENRKIFSRYPDRQKIK